MNLICRIFGHKPPVYSKERKTGFLHHEQYGRVILIGKENDNIYNAVIRGNCSRCDAVFMMCRVQLPSKFVSIKKDNEKLFDNLIINENGSVYRDPEEMIDKEKTKQDIKDIKDIVNKNIK